MRTDRPLILELLPGRFSIWPLAPGEPLPELSQVFSLTCAGPDRSVVIAEEALPKDVRAAHGYRCFRLRGESPLDQTGVLARLSTPLAAAEIPLFVISTYSTDYLLLREGDVPAARATLSAAGLTVTLASAPGLEGDR